MIDEVSALAEIDGLVENKKRIEPPPVAPRINPCHEGVCDCNQRYECAVAGKCILEIPEKLDMLDEKKKLLESHRKQNTIGIHCPLCGWRQVVTTDDWKFQSTDGHGFTCGSEQCPSHTLMVLDKYQDEKVIRKKVLGEVVSELGERKYILETELPDMTDEPAIKKVHESISTYKTLIGVLKIFISHTDDPEVKNDWDFKR